MPEGAIAVPEGAIANDGTPENALTPESDDLSWSSMHGMSAGDAGMSRHASPARAAPMAVPTPHPAPLLVQVKTEQPRGGGRYTSPPRAPAARASAVDLAAAAAAATTKTYDDFHWEDAIALLNDERVVPRPSRIADGTASGQQIFLEAPMRKRRKGDDKWVTSGGRKGASERWITANSGILKRYGRVVRAKGTPLKFAQYTMLHASVGRGGEQETYDDKGKALWAVQPVAAPQGITHVLSAPNAASGQAVLDIIAEPARKFISFQSTQSSGSDVDLGAIIQHGDGVKLESRQGDFAEYHRRADGEPPFEEGDVVGFRRGVISRRTANCSMLGVVSRKAVVEGSAPPEPERHLYDTVAYSGIVPVKLSLSTRGKLDAAGCDCPAPEEGQVLAPSGKHDGTAVLVPSGSKSTARVGILLNDYVDDDQSTKTTDASADYKLVTAVVVSPTETVRMGVGGWFPVRKLVLALIWCIVTVTVAVSLLEHLALGRLAEPRGVDGTSSAAGTVCQPFSSTHNVSLLDEYTFRDSNAVSVKELGLGCAIGYSGSPHVECPGNARAFEPVSGCVANNCSIDLVTGLVDSTGTRFVINASDTNEMYLLGKGVDTNVQPTGNDTDDQPWATRYLTVAQLGLTCEPRGSAGVATAVCTEERGKFSGFSGCRTTDLCTANSDAEGSGWEVLERCRKRQGRMVAGSAMNQALCLAGDDSLCMYCTDTALGQYCVFDTGDDSAFDNGGDWWDDGGGGLLKGVDEEEAPTISSESGAVVADNKLHSVTE
jgi:hypothetical protein